MRTHSVTAPIGRVEHRSDKQTAIILTTRRASTKASMVIVLLILLLAPAQVLLLQGYLRAQGSPQRAIFIKAFFFVARSGKRSMPKITARGKKKTEMEVLELCVGNFRLFICLGTLSVHFLP
jgi:hypothetical protein